VRECVRASVCLCPERFAVRDSPFGVCVCVCIFARLAAVEILVLSDCAQRTTTLQVEAETLSLVRPKVPGQTALGRRVPLDEDLAPGLPGAHGAHAGDPPVSGGRTLSVGLRQEVGLHHGAAVWLPRL
jgi:hypothetical protein